MWLIFTKHLLERYKTRKFTLELIRDIILHPNKIVDQEDGVKLYMKLDEGKKYLHVLVLKFKGENIKLITYFKTSKIEKYLWK